MKERCLLIMPTCMRDMTPWHDSAFHPIMARELRIFSFHLDRAKGIKNQWIGTLDRIPDDFQWRKCRLGSKVEGGSRSDPGGWGQSSHFPQRNRLHPRVDQRCRSPLGHSLGDGEPVPGDSPRRPSAHPSGGEEASRQPKTTTQEQQQQHPPD